MKYIVVLILFLSACSSIDESKYADKTVFNYNEAAGISSCDPAQARNLENMWAVNHLYNGLVQLDSALNIQPCIAKNWEIKSDGLHYVFHLRTDVKFHKHELLVEEDRKVTAHDFVYSFNRILDEKTASPGRYIFGEVNFEKGGFVAENDSTLSIHLNQPFPVFLGLLSMQFCAVVPQKIVEHYGENFRANPVGTGPFQFFLWKEGVKLVLHKNEDYFEQDDSGSPLPYLDAVTVSFIKDKHIVFMDFLRGKYDFMSGLDASYKNELITHNGSLNPTLKDKIKLNKTPFLITEYLGFLVDDSLELSSASPLQKKKVRQAINYAIDKEEMVRYLRNNVGTPAHQGFLPKGLPPYTDGSETGYAYDLKKAKQLMKEAGFEQGKNFPEISLATTANYMDFCEFVQHQMNEIGIKINVEVMQSSTHRETVSTSKSLFFRKSWLADYADAENFLSCFYSKNFSPNGPNYTHFKNATFDSLYEASLSEANDSTRLVQYDLMDSIVIEEAPIIPLVYGEVIHAYNKNIYGLTSNPMNMLELKSVRKD